MNQIWWVTRVFDKKEENADKRIEMVDFLAWKMNEAWVPKLQILVPWDYDEINIDERLDEFFRTKAGIRDIIIDTIRVKWNQFTDVLNKWILNNYEWWLDKTLIVSPEVWEFITEFRIKALLKAFEINGIWASSLVIKDTLFWWKLEQASREWRFSNTFCMRDTKTLKNYWMFWPEWEKWVEEIWPLMKIIRDWYKVAPISSDNNIEYNHLANTSSHQEQKFKSKLVRQTNIYITILKEEWKITEDLYNAIYMNWVNYDELIANWTFDIRVQYENELMELLKSWVHENYKKF